MQPEYPYICMCKFPRGCISSALQPAQEQKQRTSEVGGAVLKSERFHKEVWYLTVTNIDLKICREDCAGGWANFKKTWGSVT